MPKKKCAGAMRFARGRKHYEINGKYLPSAASLSAHQAGQQMMKKEADNIIRRNFAMVFKVLHDNYGFGAKRLVELIQLLNDFAEEAAKDELWFDTVAAWFEEYTGMDLWKDDWMEGK